MQNQHPSEMLWIPNSFTYKYQVTSQFPSLEVFTSFGVVGMAIVRHEKERSINISISKEAAMKGVQTQDTETPRLTSCFKKRS